MPFFRGLFEDILIIINQLVWPDHNQDEPLTKMGALRII